MKEIIKEFNALEYFKRKAFERKNLFSIEIDITEKCNADCIFCFQGNHENNKSQLSFETYSKLINDLKEMGLYYIGFSGGEPFLNKEFLKMLSYAKEKGFRVSFITNGQIMNENDIEYFSKIGVDRVTVSFHSLNIDNYLHHFGIKDKNLYYKSLNNIKYMIELGVSLGIAVTVTQKNIDELEQIMNFFIDLGLREQDINFNTLLTGKRSIEEIRPSEEQIKKNQKILNKAEKEKPKEISLLCSAGIISCSIDAKGNVYPCTFFNTSVGNINNESIKDIWNNSHYLKTLRSLNINYFQKCKQCEFVNRCNVCLVTNLNENNDLFTPSEAYCTMKKTKLMETKI